MWGDQLHAAQWGVPGLCGQHGEQERALQVLAHHTLSQHPRAHHRDHPHRRLPSQEVWGAATGVSRQPFLPFLYFENKQDALPVHLLHSTKAGLHHARPFHAGAHQVKPDV